MFMKQNVFIASIYSFIPLLSLKKKYREIWEKDAEPVTPPTVIRYSEAKYSYCELKSLAKNFKFDYRYQEKQYHRDVKLKVWLINFSSALNNEGRYYLVVSAGVDKAFEKYTHDGTFDIEGICNKQDVIHLKKAFYEKEEKGFYFEVDGVKQYFHDWLNQKIMDISGRNVRGKFGRHYVVDVCGVDLGNTVTIPDYNTLTDLFSKRYYSNSYLSYDQVIEGAYDLAYSLIYGNDNNEVFPDDVLNRIACCGISNNRTERLFGGHKTIVFLHTHHPYPWEKAKEKLKKKLNLNDLSACQNLYDICLIMEAKRKLKHIQKSLNGGLPSSIKEALSSISGYMNTNPYHLGEMGQRVKYLYQAMGVTELLENVKCQGELQADSVSVRTNRRVNGRMLMLTVATVIIGSMQLLQNSPLYNQTNMNNCNCCGTSIQIDCCAIICVLLILLLGCVITMMVYYIRANNRLDEIRDRLKRLE